MNSQSVSEQTIVALRTAHKYESQLTRRVPKSGLEKTSRCHTPTPPYEEDTYTVPGAANGRSNCSVQALNSTRGGAAIVRSAVSRNGLEEKSGCVMGLVAGIVIVPPSNEAVEKVFQYLAANQ